MENLKRFIAEFDIDLDESGDISTAGLMKLIGICINRMDDLAVRCEMLRDENVNLRKENVELRQSVQDAKVFIRDMLQDYIGSRAITDILIN